MFVSFLHRPLVRAVTDVDGVEVGADAGRVDGVLGIGDAHVDRNSGYETWKYASMFNPQPPLKTSTVACRNQNVRISDSAEIEA